MQQSLPDPEDLNPIIFNHLNSILNIDELKKLIDSCENDVEIVRNADIILFIGKTSAGKSTTMNYLLGCEMYLKEIKIQEQIDDRIITNSIWVIDSKNSKTKIGHDSISETKMIKCVQGPPEYGHYVIFVDSQGFSDTRGNETDIASAHCTAEALKECKSLKPILLINLHEIYEGRGDTLRETLDIASKFLVNVGDHFQNICLFFTHVDDNIKLEQIQSKIIQIWKGTNDVVDKVKKDFLKYIIREISHQRCAIIKPLEKSEKIMDNILGYIISIQEMEQPKEKISAAFSEKSVDASIAFAQETKSFIQDFSGEKKFKQVNLLLDKLLYLNKIMKQGTINEIYRDCLSYVEKEVKSELSKTIRFIQECIELGQRMSSFSMEQYQYTIYWLSVWDSNKQEHFCHTKLSSKSFIDSVQSLWNIKIEQIASNFQKEEINSYIQLIKQLKQLSVLSPGLDSELRTFTSTFNTIFDNLFMELKALIVKIFDTTSMEQVNMNGLLDEIVDNLNFIEKGEKELNALTNVKLLWHQQSILLFQEIANQVLKRIHLPLLESINRINQNLGIGLNQTTQYDSIEVQDFRSIQKSFAIIDLITKDNQARKLVPDLKRCFEESMSQIISKIEELVNELLSQLTTEKIKGQKIQLMETSIVSLLNILTSNMYIENKTLRFRFQIQNGFSQFIKQIQENIKTDLEMLLDKITSNNSNIQSPTQSEQSNFRQKNKIFKATNEIQREKKNKLAKNMILIKNFEWVDKIFKIELVKNVQRKSQKQIEKAFTKQLKNVQNLLDCQEENLDWEDLSQSFVSLNSILEISVNEEILRDQVCKIQKEITERVDEQVVKGKILIEKLNQIWEKEEFNRLDNYFSKIKQIQYLPFNLRKTISELELQLIFELQESTQKQFLQIIETKINIQIENKEISDWKKILNKLKLFNQKERIPNLLFNKNLTKDLQVMYPEAIQHIEFLWEAYKKTYTHSCSTSQLGKATAIHQQMDALQEGLRIHLPILNKEFQAMDFQGQLKDRFVLLIDIIKKKNWNEVPKYLQQLKGIQESENQYKELMEDLQQNYSSIITNFLEILSTIKNNVSELNGNCFKELQDSINEISEMNKHLQAVLEKDFFTSSNNQILFEQLANWIEEYQGLILRYLPKGQLLNFDQGYTNVSKVLQQMQRRILLNQKCKEKQEKFNQCCEKAILELENPQSDWPVQKIKQYNQQLNQLKSLSQTDNQLQLTYQQKYESNQKKIGEIIQQNQDQVHQILSSQKQGSSTSSKTIEYCIKKIQSWQEHLRDHIDVEDLQENLDGIKNVFSQNQQEILYNKIQFIDSNNIQEIKQSDQDMKQLCRQNKPLFDQISGRFTYIFEDNVTQLKNQLAQSQRDYSQVLQSLLRICNLSLLTTFPQFKEPANEQFKRLISEIQKGYEQMLKGTTGVYTEEAMNNYQYFQQICSVLESHQITIWQTQRNQVESLRKKFNEEIYANINKASNQYELDLQKMEITGMQYSLDILKRYDVYITQIQKHTEPEALNLGFTKQLIDLIKHETFINYKEAQKRRLTLMNGLVQNLDQDWETKDLQSFVARYKCNSSLQTLNKTQNQQEKQNQLTQNYIGKIVVIKDKILDQLSLQQFDNVFLEDYQFMQRLKNEVTTPDLRTTINDSFQQIFTKIQECLSNRKMNFLVDKPIAQYASDLIELRTISDEIPPLKTNVQKTINECMNVLKDKASESNLIEELVSQFEKFDSPLGNLIIQETTHFTEEITKRQEKLTGSQHNASYVLANFQIIPEKGKSLPLKDEQKELLAKEYSNYEDRIKECFQRYKNYQQHGESLIKSIKELANKNKNLKLKYWNNSNKTICNQLLVHVSTLWTLLGNKYLTWGTKDKLRQVHASQIFSIMFLLGFDKSDGWYKINTLNLFQEKFENQLIQIYTGEGKSVILGILATILALIGIQVDVVSYSKYLSDRDQGSFSEIFQLLDIQKQIRYGTFSELSEQLINKQGDIRLMTENLMTRQPNKQILQTEEHDRILLIDEVDVFFSADFYGQTYNPLTLFNKPEIENIMNDIWTNRKLSSMELSKLIFTTSAFKKLISDYQQFQALLTVHVKLMASAVGQLKDHKYEIVEGKIGYKIQDSISFTTHYGYLTTFAYFQECDLGYVTQEVKKEKIGITLFCGNFSYAESPNMYTNILGVTGTLESLHESSKEIINTFKVKQSKSPSMFGASNRKFDVTSGVFVEEVKEEYFLKIKDQSLRAHEEGRPVLIFFKDSLTLEQYYQSTYLPVQQSQVIIINQKTKNISDAIQKATRKGKVVLADRVFGRGTDFYCSVKEIDNKGGILVIQTFISIDYSEEVQIKGRTARQANQGQYILILLSGDLVDDLHLTSEEIVVQKKSISTMYDFLDSKRKEVWGEQLKVLSSSVKQASIKHQNTINYKDHLIKNEREKAVQCLLEFNASFLKKSSPSTKTGNQHFILCLDESGSMSSTDGGTLSRWAKLIEAITSFVEGRGQVSDGTDIVSVIYYSHVSRVVVRCQPLQNVLNEILRVQPCWGGTSFYVAIEEVFQLLTQQKPEHQSFKKAVLFLSDGGDGNPAESLKSLEKLKSSFKDQITMWWNMGFGPGADGGILLKMSILMKECGGEYKTAITMQELQEEFVNLACFDQGNLKS